uniref:Uncharacterized protein n=1 Tax=Oryza nivara TaxID=4536 RepID=A0A0E0H1F7_ORYNI
MSSALDKFIAVVKETKPRWDLRAATRCLEAVLARLLPPRQRRSSHSRRRPPNHGIDNDDDRDIGTDRALSRLFVKGISLATLMRCASSTRAGSSTLVPWISSSRPARRPLWTPTFGPYPSNVLISSASDMRNDRQRRYNKKTDGFRVCTACGGG